MVYTKHCCYGTCNSDSRYADRPDMQGVFFINFPKPKTQREKCEKWIRRCGRPKEQFNVDRVKKMTFICSKHFVGRKGPTSDHPDPTPVTTCPQEVKKFMQAPRKPPRTRPTNTAVPRKRKRLDNELGELVAAETLLTLSSAEISQQFSKSHTVGTQTDPVVFASQVNMADAGCQTVYDKCGLQTKVETMILRNAPSPTVVITSAMKSEEEQYISTGNQLPSSDAAPKDARYMPSDINQKKLSSISQSPIGSRMCGSVASVNLVNQSSEDYQVLQGLTRIKSEDHPAEIHLQEGFVQFNKTCHQKDQRPTNYGEPHVQVKVEKVQSDECNSSSEETRKWVACGGGLLKEVLKVDHTDWSVETSKDSSENIDQKEQHNDETVSEISVTHKNVEPYITTKCTKQFMQSNHPNSHEQINTGEKQHTCTSNTYSIPKPNQGIRTCMKLFAGSRKLHVYKRIHTVVKPYTCARCRKSFTTLSSLKIHKRIHTGVSHTGVKPYTCSTCGKLFATLSHCKIHERIHTGVKPYTCSTCGKLFTQSSSLKTHKQIHTGGKPCTCSMCGKLFTSSVNLKRHEQIHTGVKPYACSTCGKTFIMSSHCKAHEKTHIGVKPYTCATCGKSFAVSSSLKIHEKCHTSVNGTGVSLAGVSLTGVNVPNVNLTGVKLYSCSTCGKSFTRSSECEVHEMFHADMKVYTCSTCGKVFDTFSHCKNHEKTHIGVNPYTCSTCGKSFTTFTYIKIHERIHTGVKPYTCSTCGKLFTHSSSLYNHERTHTGYKPFTCSTCGKSFTTSSYCKIHENNHTGVKPYTCATCGKSFTRCDHFKNHEKNHTSVSIPGGVKLYSCSICGKSFTGSTDCKIHEMFHADVKVYTCGTCETTFTSFSSLKIHERIHTSVK